MAQLARSGANMWSRRFQLLLGLTLAAEIALGVVVYLISRYAYVRAELAIVAFLLICGIIVLSALQEPVARRILLSTGCLILFALLVLAIAPSSASTSSGTRTIAQAPVQVLATSGIVLSLVAMIGKIITDRAARRSNIPYEQNYWVTGLAHLAAAAVAGSELLLQSAAGSQIRLLPFTTPLYASINLNTVTIAVLGAIVLFSLVSFRSPLTWLDGLMMLILGGVCLLFQYTFGAAELARLGPSSGGALVTSINLALTIAPLVIALLAFLTEWGRFIAPLWLAVQLTLLLPFVGGARAGARGQGVLQTLPFGQIVLYALAASIVLLTLRLLFYWDRRQLNGLDGITSAIIALAVGLTTWTLGQRAFQLARTLSTPRGGGNLLFAANSLTSITYIVGIFAALALLFVVLYTFFNHSNIWLTRTESIVGTLLVLGVTAAALLLLNVATPASGQGSYIAATTLNPHNFNPGLPSIAVRNQYVLDALFVLLLLFYIITLIRQHWHRVFGHTERALLILSGFACLLMLAGTGRQAALPLVAANAQKLTAFILAVFTPERILATAILFAALISLLWLFRAVTLSQRIVFAVIFGLAILCALIYYFSALSLLLTAALVLLTTGTLIAGRGERLQSESSSPGAQNSEEISITPRL